jgi:sacsin
MLLRAKADPLVWRRLPWGERVADIPPCLPIPPSPQTDPQLASVLVDVLGLPLACELPPAAEAALLQGTRGAKAVSPSLVRRHLQQLLRGPAGGAELSRVLLAWRPTAAQAAATTTAAASALPSSSQLAAEPVQPSPPATAAVAAGKAPGDVAAVPPCTAAALLLRYCLSDLPMAAAAGPPAQQQLQQRLQAELDGLPLLPLADGTLGHLQATVVRGTQQQQQLGRGPGPMQLTYVLTLTPLEAQLLSGLQVRTPHGLPACL